MREKFFLPAAACIVLAAGCTLIPDFTRPAPPVPAAWPEGPAYQGFSGSSSCVLAPDLEWREFFEDERLQKIIEIALNNNRDMRVAALNVERARALYRIQRNELLPTVNAAGRSLRERVPGDISGREGSVVAEQHRLNIGIAAWEIDFFGRLQSLEENALQEYLATEEARNAARILLVSEVANACLTLTADRETLKLAQSTVESQKASYELIRRRFEVGLASELVLRQVQTRVDAARVDVASCTE